VLYQLSYWPKLILIEPLYTVILFLDESYAYDSADNIFSTLNDPDHCGDFSVMYNYALCIHCKLM